MRLQVFLSHAGISSRRKAFEQVRAGQVSVNGKVVTEPSTPVQSSDIIAFQGKKVSLREKVYILLNKPADVVTTVEDRFAEKKVMDFLPQEFRHLYPVGRLDKQTTGLLILTNDGELTHRLTHPSFEVDKVYQARLDRALSENDRMRLQKGVLLEGAKTAPCRIKKTDSGPYEITVHEGRKRQIRKMFELLRYRVLELVRLRQGSIALGDLGVGKWRFLKREEVIRLLKEVGIS
jgi:23S rRNA pseudouridine2605 synthase